ncbi:MAG TPA: FAD-dependent oxidoreductase [Jatrophihabitans sp.]|uniref:NAD(P)/FAD-dependent oxidoreductase n=1 Tax=Jatrophihabitans sp. TaxID=1932789 RepID=UPI002F0C0807
MPDRPLTGSSHEPDVLVIGGGAAGLWCAYFLRLAGHTVTVLDRDAVGDPVACSYGNTGFVANGGVPLAGPAVLRRGLLSALRPDDRLALPPTLDRRRLHWLWQLHRAGRPEQVRRSASVMAELKRRSLEILHGLRVSDLPHPDFTATGVVQAYKTADAFARARQALPRALAAGVRLRVLEPDELRALEPDTEFDIAGALYNEGAGFLRVPSFIVSLARTLTEMGVDLVENCAVEGFEVSGRTVLGLRTDRGDFRPREIVVAAGSWSGTLARLLDVNLELQPIKGYSITVRRPDNAPRGLVLLVEGTVAVRPFTDQLRYGGDMALSGMDTSISRRRVGRMLQTVHAHLPAMSRTETLQVWAGLRPCTPDSLPFIGRAPAYDNLTVAAGHGHSGMGLTPVGGQLVAQLIEGSQPSMDLAPFRLDRYNTPPPWLRPRAAQPVGGLR